MAADGWGASWSFGPVHPTATNHIIHTKTTLVPGRFPALASNVGPLFLWPGLSNPTSSLIQTTMDDWSSNENSSYCSGNGSQWCVEASVFNGGQINGPTVAIDPDDHVTIDYELGSDGETWTQTVTSQKLGKVVSTLQSASGLMYGGGFGFATEADADSYTIDTQYYLCTEVHLAAADPEFGATGVGGVGAQYGATGTGSGIGSAKNLHTPDNGLTWLVDLITLPAMDPQGTQTAPPTYDCSSTSVDAGAPSDAGTADATKGVDATAGSDATAGLDATTGSDASGGSDAAGHDAIALGSDSNVAGEAGVGSSDSGQNQRAGSSDGGSNGAGDVGNPPGCGCRIAGDSSSRGNPVALAGVFAVAIAAERRRRQRARGCKS
jgi:MYXO-CTERM domain-containing protein